MSESLRNDGRIWVPAKLEDAQAIRDGKKNQQNEEDRDYYLERRYPSFGISFLVMLLLVLQRKK
jgi:succinate dehydrogenase / fumarate reductase flavoprotein subunit